MPTLQAQPDTTELTSMLRDAGLRVTQPRLAVLNVLLDHPHISADVAYSRVREALPQTSLQATYHVLTALADAGLVRRIEPAGHPGLYELRVGDNHHHVICTTCGAVSDVDCVVGHAPCLAPDHAGGFTIDQAEVTFWGTCGTCRE